ncbi:MAG: hypothetical protein UY61_C0037G0002 [Candidatus Adlerbacteria bacterium GW2011_GWC1_50_9]|uniref:Uncharacterized protein n=1 Tax=Candidatus Adlerbacteria bacterium GW2011_GWC1_50_9 TaxID=1618608 RepID=A0A0G1ZLN5_9BACT|nr:MAG: hypothetical protein UY61_C0037G0002 [Candidatus Adlerbacteria bacterium GW2011_GWC1_50_9]
MSKIRKQSIQRLPAWHEVEQQIIKEIKWLRNTIETYSDATDERYNHCRECYLRKIATLIAIGDVKATEIAKKSPLTDFWSQMKKLPKIRINHGSSWHQEIMERIENHFIRMGYKVIREPTLHWGRADLDIYKQGERDLLIEVGTVSLCKLFINLKTMMNFTYLVVPNDDKLIEFIRK